MSAVRRRPMRQAAVRSWQSRSASRALHPQRRSIEADSTPLSAKSGYPSQCASHKWCEVCQSDAWQFMDDVKDGDGDEMRGQMGEDLISYATQKIGANVCFNDWEKQIGSLQIRWSPIEMIILLADNLSNPFWQSNVWYPEKICVLNWQEIFRAVQLIYIYSIQHIYIYTRNWPTRVQSRSCSAEPH